MDLSDKNSRIRCLCVITSLPLGGAEKSLLRLVRSSSKEIDYLVVSLDSQRDLEGEFESANIKVINLNIGSIFTAVSGIISLVKVVKSWHPDVIYYWMYHAMLFSLAVKILCPKAPVIWGVRHNNLDLKLNKLGTVFIAKFLVFFSSIPKKIIYCSDESMRFHSKVGYKNNRAQLIENGFDSKEFLHKDDFCGADIARLKEKYFPLANSDSILIGCCGRYDPLKRFENFIAAAQILIQQELKNVVFCLIGEGLPERQQQLLENLPAEQKNFFQFVGATKDIKEVFPCLDILIQTSFSESFPNVIPEAMLCGAAVIATDVGQTSEIVGSDGILIPPDDIVSTARAANNLLSDPAKLKHLQKVGAIRIRKNFGIDKVVTENIRIFRDIVCGN